MTLLQAVSLAFVPPPQTRINKLPIELQDRILDHVSAGPVEAARLGCLLELGSQFAWMRSDGTRRGGDVVKLEAPTHRSHLTPVDSRIHFGDTFSGLAYR
jgi:hypothetical protein